MPEQIRRRILCLRARPEPQTEAAAPFDWTVTLARHADVVLHEGDGDLAALCAEAEPDLIVLEGLTAARPWPPAIGNPGAHAGIPRVLYLRGEPFDPLRALSLRVAQDLGVEAVVLPGEAHRQHMPELDALACCFAPPAFDGALYRDRGLDKVLAVMVLDSNVEPEFYPWRTTLAAEVRRVMPTLLDSREPVEAGEPGFARDAEARARTIGESWFCAVDTGRCDALSADHLHVPAAGAVLVAPVSPALAAIGFVDMANCVLGSGPDLMRKLDLLSRAPAEYARVREAGMALVRDRCGAPVRHVLVDWLDCRLRLKPGQVVQQVDRYGPFRGVTPTLVTPSVLAAHAPDSVMTAALRQAQAAILSGEKLLDALPVIEAAARWAPRAAEPLFLFSLFALLNGNPVEAAMGIGSRAERLGARSERLAAFDPVEAAWLMLVARLIGHAPLEQAMREQAAAVRHVSLRRMLWLLDRAEDDVSLDPGLLGRQPGDLPSLHWLGEEDFTHFADLVRRVLMANRASAGHAAVARRLRAAA